MDSYALLPPATPEVVLYNTIYYVLLYGGFVWTLLTLYVYIRLQIGPRIRFWVESRYRSRLVHGAIQYAILAFYLLVCRIPLGLIAFYVEHRYGFSNTSLGLWFKDRGTGYLLGLVNVPAVCAGYWLLERSPKRWWFWLSLGAIPFHLFNFFINPLLVAPSYNRFVPLPEGALRSRLVSLATRAGLQEPEVFVVDISRRTRKLNAYVSGVGPSRRIVLWDTTLKALSEDEIVAIIGHELGHYAEGHVWWRFASFSIGGFVVLYVLSRLLPWIFMRHYDERGVRGLNDPAGLPIVMATLSVILFVQSPLENGLYRWQERRADRFGLALTRDGASAARAFATFANRDFSNPDPPAFIVFWSMSHPPLRERVERALEWR